MPPRPSRNLDRSLLAAGRTLFPSRGCGGMSVREVADAAGVNLGMFHYHFKSRETFLRALMQQTYEEMFARLSLEVGRDKDPVVNLRAALRAIGRFVRDHRPFLARVLADALSNEKCARDFLADNLPRHLGILQGLIEAGQRAGRFAPLPVTQLVGTCAGALAMPILFGGALVDSGALAAPMAAMIEATLLSDAALDQRIELVLVAISAPGTVPAARAGTKKRGRS